MTQTVPIQTLQSQGLQKQPSDLLDAYLEDSWDALAQFDAAREHLIEALEPDSIENLRILSHRMRGTAAVYGFPQLAKLSELCEKVCEAGPHLTDTELPDLLSFLEQFSVVARAGVERIAQGRGEGDIGLDFSGLGGSKSLEGLLQKRPTAFKRTHAAVPEKLEPSGSLSARLRRFHAQNLETWEYFAPEAQELLEGLRGTLETTGAVLEGEGLTTLFRGTHTLKGSAYMVGFEEMGLLAHRLEDLMSAVRDEERPYTLEIGEALSLGVGALQNMLDTAEGRTSPLEESLFSTLESLTRLLPAERVLELATLLGTGADAPLEVPGERGAALLFQLEGFFEGNLEYWGDYSSAQRARIEELRELLGRGETPDIHALLRSTHGLKSEARALEVPGMQELSSQLEELFARVRDDELALDAPMMTTAEVVLDALERMLLAAEGAYSAPDLEHSVLHAEEKLHGFLGERTRGETNSVKAGLSAAQPANRTIRVNLEKLDRLMNLVGEMVGLRARFLRQMSSLEAVGNLLEISRSRMNRTVSEFETKYLNPRLASITPAKPNEVTPGRSKLSTTQEMFNELEFDTYSDLNILARSVLEMGDDLSEVTGQLGTQLSGLREETETLQRLSYSLRDEVTGARMVPLSTLFSRLSRLVRSGEGGKLFTLETFGETVEVDNFILEELLDPLLHLIKNAAYHGIETSDERKLQGKPPQGRIVLRASVEGGSVLLEVEDDGQGLQLGAIRRSALEKRMRSPEALENLSDEDTIQLIFEPGLSTAREVSVDAGRGVGMDAVAAGVRRLNGEISVSSEAGLGTRFTLRLPLTLVVTEALLVETGGQTFALPATGVRQVRFVSAGEIQILEGVPHFSYEGSPVRLLSLATLLGLNAQLSETQALEGQPTVILDLAGERVGLSVDAFVGLEEIVQKPLSRTLAGLTHLAGATVASSGEVIALLDPGGTVRLAAALPSTSQQRAVSVQHVSKTRRLMLVDDSVSVRRIVSKMMIRAGFEVVTAVDGQDALEQLRRDQDFYAVLSDLEMPRMNGYELIESLKAREETRLLPIIVMTTRAGEKHRDLAFRLGASEYFSKPIEEARLLNYLQHLEPLILAS